MNKTVKNKYVLVLPSWYPSEAHKFNGDFNQRLVKAMSSKVEQIVLHIIAKSNITKPYFTLTEEKNIKTYLVYYPLKSTLLGKIYAKLQYFLLHLKFLKLILSQNGKPQLTHVYVFWMAGIFALFLKKILAIPYIITEHSSGFYTNSPADLNQYSFLTKLLFKKIISHSSHIITVAKKLKTRVQLWAPLAKITVIPNVVDTAIFNIKVQKAQQTNFNFVHISSMIPLKNLDGLLSGFEKALQKNHNMHLTLVGRAPECVLNKIKQSVILQDKVICIGEVPYFKVKTEMVNSNALIQFSKFESLPCVILEALCCGLPVITSNVGGCAEVINSSNGILVESENIAQLSQAIHDMALNYNRFDNAKISENACNLFSYNVVANQVYSVYQGVI